MALLTPEQAVCERLKEVTAVTDLLGAKIFPEAPTQGTELPYAVYSRTDSETSQTLKPAPTTRVTQYGIDVEIYAKTKVELHAVGVAVAAALQGWKDMAKGVQGCFQKDSSTREDVEEGVENITISFALFQKPVTV